MFYNVTLICTRHEECGKCNASELHNIINKIAPDAIFEELSYSHFDDSYDRQSLVTVESNAVKEYLQNNRVEHIPVDTYELPTSYYNDIDYMYNRIFNRNGVPDSYRLRRLLDDQLLLISRDGFSYLNSNQNDKIFEEIDRLTDATLKTMNEESLFRIRRMEKEVIQNREYEMLQNIYAYSKEHAYDNAILFIGSGHRKSIMKKIVEFKKADRGKLNWKYFATGSLE